MKLSDITIEQLQIPFKIAFSHSSASRTMTDSVLVKASTEFNDGYGESCPREYVTNETYQSASTFFKTHKASLMESITSLESLKQWMTNHQNDIDKHPAAWCAIELAILDLLAKEQLCSVEKLLDLPELTGDYFYTAVLGDSSLESFSKLLAQYKAMGFSDYKIKLSGQLDHDKAKCDLIAEQIKNPRMRCDANNLWNNSEQVIEYIKQLNHAFFALEEPLKACDYEGLTLIANTLNLKIILDESFVKQQQFDYLKDKPQNWIINIRISKMGGLLRALDIAEQAKHRGIACIAGAQVGETSILTRAAITLVNVYRDVIIAQEGGCGTYLLEKDISQPVLMFGLGGKISESQVSNLTENGFGLKIECL